MLADAAVEQARDVRMFHARQDLTLLHETLDQSRSRARNEFQRDALLEHAVGTLGKMHLAHAALAEQAQQAIRPELLMLR